MNRTRKITGHLGFSLNLDTSAIMFGVSVLAIAQPNDPLLKS